MVGEVGEEGKGEEGGVIIYASSYSWKPVGGGEKRQGGEREGGAVRTPKGRVGRWSDKRREKQRRLKGRAGRRRMTVTAQLMMGHEMALTLIMIERRLERQIREGGGEGGWLTGCEEEAGGVKRRRRRRK